jgi:23S rRNA (adenine2030-N6)-methyltransferase
MTADFIAGFAYDRAMNYRHAFHAGNFADVFKHAAWSRILQHLRAKPAPFRVIDTHAGAGLYDLTGPEASRSGEWRDGIARLLAAPLGADARALLTPYLDALAAFNPDGRLAAYPGSPALTRHWLRSQDRLTACELEPGAAAALADSLRGDARAKAVAIDGWMALNAYVPPPERRGAVLVDPPFEEGDDFRRLSDHLATAQRKWATGIFVLWYPIKDPGESEALARRLRRLAMAKVMRAELHATPGEQTRLGGAGLIVVNPPWTLEAELRILLPALAAALSPTGVGRFRLDWLRGEK